jgi:GNAT superfamily N-acetyltransferase
VSDDVRIERATESDFESLLDLHVLSWRTAYAGMFSGTFLATEIGPLFRAWRGESLPALEGGRTWVARSCGEIVGFADTGPGRDPDAGPSCAELYTLHVAPVFRGRGMGAKLLRRALDDLRERGYEAVTAWVLEPNARAAFLRVARLAMGRT